MTEHGMSGRPKVAVVDANTLAVLGLKQILQNVMPIMTVDTFGSFSELESAHPDQYAHFFVAMDIVLSNRNFFLERQRKTIVLTLSLNETSQLHDFHSLCINQPEPQLIRQLLILQQHAHHGGRNLPRLNIGLSTVITHRKNIMDKLGMKSVSALTIYAVMHGYVDINKI